MAVAVFATLVAAALALALVAAVHPTAAPLTPSVVVLHEQAPDSAERNQALATQRASAIDQNQAPDAKERNEALSQGK